MWQRQDISQFNIILLSQTIKEMMHWNSQFNWEISLVLLNISVLYHYRDMSIRSCFEVSHKNVYQSISGNVRASTDVSVIDQYWYRSADNSGFESPNQEKNNSTDGRRSFF